MERGEEPIEQENEPETSNGEEVSHPMDAFLEEKAYGLHSPRRGEIRTGTIARITDSDILVDIGYKSEGVIPSREFEQIPPERREGLSVGSEVTVFVLRTGGRNGTVLLSLTRAEEEKDWIEAEHLLKTKDIFEGEISGYNKGGLIVKLGQIRGFIPASQVSMSRRWRSDGDSPDQRWGKMVGEPIVAKVIEVERRRNRLILSERAAAREARDILKERLIEELQPGEVREGHVISLADFGAFVDIGGADGLVHTSEISWKRISHPKDVLKVGQEVKVKILSIDPEQKRISLSLRELEEDPWDKIADQYREGQLVEGSITKLTKFGAFASLKGDSDYEVEGLVHISELSDRHIVHPREIVSEGETLTLRVIRVDRERRRIGLSLKRVDSPDYAELDWQEAMKELSDEDEAPSEGESAADEEVRYEEAMLAAEEQLEESPDEGALEIEGVDESTAVEESPEPEAEVDEVELGSATTEPEAIEESEPSDKLPEGQAADESEQIAETVELATATDAVEASSTDSDSGTETEETEDTLEEAPVASADSAGDDTETEVDEVPEMEAAGEADSVGNAVLESADSEVGEVERDEGDMDQKSVPREELDDSVDPEPSEET
jgi:small subunit ribosomal protein S1